MKKPWEGKLMWIWNVNRTNNGDVFNIIDQARRMGLTGVLVKYHEGSQPYGRNGDGSRAEFQKDFRRVLPHLKQAGLSVGAWGYNYMENPAGEAAMIKQALDDGADWYCFDPEGEVERTPHSQTEECLRLVRTGYPAAYLGYAPFPISQYHSDYPYQLFDHYCDVNLPQVYWEAIGWPVDKVWSMMLAGFAQLKLQKPVAPVGQAYDMASYEDILKFAELAKAAYCTGLSFWVWEQAKPRQIDAVSAIWLPPGTETSAVPVTTEAAAEIVQLKARLAAIEKLAREG